MSQCHTESLEGDSTPTPQARPEDIVLEGLSGEIVLEGLVRDRVQAALNPIFQVMGDLAKKTPNPAKTKMHLMIAVEQAARGICEEQSHRAIDAFHAKESAEFNNLVRGAFKPRSVSADYAQQREDL